jgi:hypothetical protein
VSAEDIQKRHWIYVLGDRTLRNEARLWQRSKSAAGKSYTVLGARLDETPSGKLKHVAAGDVVYVFARLADQNPGAVGQTAKDPSALAALLKAEGLGNLHADLKLFLPNSGGKTPGARSPRSFAEQLYRCLHQSHPHLAVYGYFGEVSHSGFDGHKTANLRPGESIEDLNYQSWNDRRLRARENRVRFPPKTEESL